MNAGDPTRSFLLFNRSTSASGGPRPEVSQMILPALLLQETLSKKVEVRPNQVRAEPASKTTMADKSKFDNLRVKMKKEISAAQLAKRKWNREMKLNEYTSYRTMVSILHLHVDVVHCGPWHYPGIPVRRTPSRRCTPFAGAHYAVTKSNSIYGERPHDSGNTPPPSLLPSFSPPPPVPPLPLPSPHDS